MASGRFRSFTARCNLPLGRFQVPDRLKSDWIEPPKLSAHGMINASTPALSMRTRPLSAMGPAASTSGCKGSRGNVPLSSSCCPFVPCHVNS